MKTRMKSGALTLLFVTMTAPTQAQDAPVIPPVVSDLLGCRSVADPADRLACFDQRAAVIEGAVRERDLVVVDRSQVRKVRRSVFGFSSSDPLPFASKPDEIPDMFEGKIVSVSALRGGRFVLQVDDTVWELQETGAFQRVPKVGDPVIIRRGVLGSYKLAVDGRTSLRARRLK